MRDIRRRKEDRDEQVSRRRVFPGPRSVRGRDRAGPRVSVMQVRLGLRADTLHETLLDALARSTGAYARANLDVVTAPGSVEVINVGLVSCLLEVGEGIHAWRVILVASMAPLFWDVPAPASGHHRSASGSAIEALRALAGVPTKPADPDRVVVGPGAAADVVCGRLPDAFDLGDAARFPALGLAVRPGCDRQVALRMETAHREALAALHDDGGAVADVLRRHGVDDSDVERVTHLLRQRFQEVRPEDAAAHAVRGAHVLGLPEDPVRRAFAPL